MSSPDYDKVSREVRRLLEDFGLDHPPINPIALAKGQGIDVTFVEFGDDYKNVSGFYDPRDKSIYVNKKDPPGRQSFTIAHELAHAILHHQWAASEDYKVLWRDSEYVGNDWHEKEANAFAAKILVPRSMLDKYYKRLSEADLAKLFAVSVPMIRNRLAFEYGF